MTQVREDIGASERLDSSGPRAGWTLAGVSAVMRSPLVESPLLFTLAVLIVSLLLLWIGTEVLKVFFIL